MNLSFETIAIGDEILNGKISDTNSTFVADQLFKRGFSLSRVTVVPDDEHAILFALEEASHRAEFVICFGGLGPTSDDKTAEVVSKKLGCKVIDHPPSKAKMLQYYRDRGREVNTHSFKQILFPEAATALSNRNGMAPGFHCKLDRGEFYFLPGVPSEMRVMFQEQALPDIEQRLRAAGKYASVLARTWRCVGIPESELQTVMDPMEAKVRGHGWLGYRTRFPENHLSLYLKNEGSDKEKLFARLSEEIGQTLKPWVYGEGNDELENLVIDGLKSRKWRLAVAESATGGRVASRLTCVPGSSDVFWGGVACYQVAAKKTLLGVSVADPEAAVSAKCTRELAEKVREISGGQIGAALTGYLGPTGGTPTDPIGTIYLCVSREGGVRESRLVLPPRENGNAVGS